jgi:hypothetical protein
MNLDYKIAYLKPYLQQMKDKLLDYIAAAENATDIRLFNEEKLNQAFFHLFF